MVKTIRDVVYVWKQRKPESPMIDCSSGLLFGTLPRAHRWNILAVQMDVYGGRAKA